MRIAIDAMGGEHSLQATIPGIQKAVQNLKDPQLNFVVFGRKDQIDPLIKQYNLTGRVDVVHVDDVVKDTDHPFKIFQTGNNTSMGRALSAVQEGLADGVVSSGSTGGYVTLAHKIFGLMPHVNKIALPGVIPTNKGQSVFLDLGASISVTENDIVQFAVMGDFLYKAQFGGDAPRVGILNIGTEDIKGPPFLTKAHKILKASNVVNYKGFVEGTDLFKGDIDVIVADGYAGNIALKAIEGTANFIGDNLKNILGGSIVRKILSLGVIGALSQFKKKIDRRQYNGAVLLGVNHLAVKSHGDANAEAFACAIAITYKMVQYQLIDQVRDSFQIMHDRAAQQNV